MSAYSTQDAGIAGTIFGSDFNIETKIVASGVTFEFGEAVFVDAGDEETGYAPDSSDASLKFLGVSVISGYEDKYVDFSEMNVLTRGEIYVTVASGLTTIANQAAYVMDDKNDSKYKKFTTANVGGSYSIGGYFRSNVSGGLARVELRGIS
jgi:hypothetical protein